MKKDISSDVVYIYRTYITLRDGTRLYAWQRGKKAFRLAVPAEHRD